MEDRVSLYPGRVTLTPVEGLANTYDMVRADQPTQVGTPLSKANLLKDLTTAQFGLDSTAVPDDVLSWIGKYNEHWWSSIVPETYGYVRALSFPSTSYGYWFVYECDALTFQYSTEINVDVDTGSVSLKNPQAFAITGLPEYGNPTSTEYNAIRDQIKALAPCYVTGLYKIKESSIGSHNNLKGDLSNDILYLPSGVTRGDIPWVSSDYYEEDSGYILLSSTGSDYNSDVSLVGSTYAKIAEAGDIVYRHSTDRNAYPDSGTVDGITYTYLGRPFENIVNIPKMEIVSYIGTGVSGSGAPNSITFSFAPKLAFILSGESIYGLGYSSNSSTVSIMNSARLTTSYVAGTAFSGYVQTYGYGKKSEDGKTFYWYNTHSTSQVTRQFNESGVSYYVLALG